MAKHTIKIKKYSDVIEERVANATITPGMLVQLMSTNKVRAHAGSGDDAVPMFALEDELQGNGIDDNYAAGDMVQVWIPNRGDQVLALLADGENASIGSFLISNGNGYLKVLDEESGARQPFAVVAMAVEAVDRSSSSGADTNTTGRIEVMVV